MGIASHYSMHIRKGCLWVTVPVILNPLDTMGISLNVSRKSCIKYYNPYINSYGLMEAFMCPWLVKC